MQQQQQQHEEHPTAVVASSQVMPTENTFEAMRCAALSMFKQRTRDLTRVSELQTVAVQLECKIRDIQCTTTQLHSRHAALNAQVEAEEQRARERESRLATVCEMLTQFDLEQRMFARAQRSSERVTGWIHTFVQQYVAGPTSVLRDLMQSAEALVGGGGGGGACGASVFGQWAKQLREDTVCWGLVLDMLCRSAEGGGEDGQENNPRKLCVKLERISEDVVSRLRYWVDTDENNSSNNKKDGSTSANGDSNQGSDRNEEEEVVARHAELDRVRHTAGTALELATHINATATIVPAEAAAPPSLAVPFTGQEDSEAFPWLALGSEESNRSTAHAASTCLATQVLHALNDPNGENDDSPDLTSDALASLSGLYTMCTTTAARHRAALDMCVTQWVHSHLDRIDNFDHEVQSLLPLCQHTIGLAASWGLRCRDTESVIGTTRACWERALSLWNALVQQHYPLLEQQTHRWLTSRAQLAQDEDIVAATRSEVSAIQERMQRVEAEVELCQQQLSITAKEYAAMCRGWWAQEKACAERRRDVNRLRVELTASEEAYQRKSADMASVEHSGTACLYEQHRLRVALLEMQCCQLYKQITSICANADSGGGGGHVCIPPAVWERNACENHNTAACLAGLDAPGPSLLLAPLPAYADHEKDEFVREARECGDEALTVLLSLLTRMCRSSELGIDATEDAALGNTRSQNHEDEKDENATPSWVTRLIAAVRGELGCIAVHVPSEILTCVRTRIAEEAMTIRRECTQHTAAMEQLRAEEEKEMQLV